MRILPFSILLAILPAPLFAKTTEPVPPPPLTDPAMADRLGAMTDALSKAFLDLPVGEIEAAVEGRPVTPADRQRTLRELGRRENPDFERNLQRQLADSRAAMQAGMKALSTALPAMMKSLNEAKRELEKATANLPSPNYPKP